MKNIILLVCIGLTCVSLFDKTTRVIKEEDINNDGLQDIIVEELKREERTIYEKNIRYSKFDRRRFYVRDTFTIDGESVYDIIQTEDCIKRIHYVDRRTRLIEHDTNKDGLPDEIHIIDITSENFIPPILECYYKDKYGKFNALSKELLDKVNNREIKLEEAIHLQEETTGKKGVS